MANSNTSRLHTPEARAARAAAPRLDPLERALANPGKRALALAGKCWDCVGGDADPNPRARIRWCTQVRCPLHSVRPYRRPEQAQ